MDRDGQPFGLERLCAVLRACAGMSAQDTCDMAYSAVRAHCGVTAPHDDVLLVAAQVA
jgi:serine phosphatase RsbU (regulator of sigma subunit)